MSESNSWKRWEKTRKKGKRSYCLSSSLIWLVVMGITFPVYDHFVSHETSWGPLFVSLLIAPIIGYWGAMIEWNIMEKMYSKRRH